MPFSRPYGTVYFQTRSAAKNPLESAKLDGEFNAILEYFNSQLNFIQNVSEWNISQVLPTYISTTQFSLTGDVTADYATYRKIRVVIGTNDPVYSTVGASAYDGGTGLTTVTLLDAILAENITELAYGFIGADLSKSSFPTNLLNIGVAVVDTTPYAVTKHATLILVDATDASIICNLASYADLGPGKMYIFRKIASDTSEHTVTIAPDGSEKIDGKDNLILQQPGDTAIIMTNATDGWEVIQDRVSKLPANFLPGIFGNLKVTNNSGAPQNKIDISADFVVVKDGSGNIIPLHDISQTIDFTVSGQDNGNCLDAGSLVNATWYYFWEIAKPDGTKAALGSTSSTAPQMPTGYTYKKLLGVDYYTGGAFRNFLQYNRQIIYMGYIDITGAINSTSWTAKDITAYVPPIAIAAKIQAVHVVSSGGPAVAIAWDNSGTNGKRYLISYISGVPVDSIEGAMTPFWYTLNPSSPQTVYVKSGAANERGRIYILGYEVRI